MNKSDRSAVNTVALILIGGSVLVILCLCLIVYGALHCAFFSVQCVPIVP